MYKKWDIWGKVSCTQGLAKIDISFTLYRSNVRQAGLSSVSVAICDFQMTFDEVNNAAPTPQLIHLKTQLF